jgi:hypothetical protein
MIENSARKTVLTSLTQVQKDNKGSIADLYANIFRAQK